MESSKKMAKAFLAMACILGASQASARPATDKMTICYGVDKQDKMSFKTPCIATNTGGAGVMVLIYQINGREYLIESSDDGDFLNGRAYTTYLRDAFFGRVPDSSDAYSYYCYKSKAAHFCSQQTGNN